MLLRSTATGTAPAAPCRPRRPTMRSILATTALVSFAALGTTQNQGIQLVAGIDGAVEVPFDPAMVPPTGLTVEAWITFDESTVPVGSGFYWPTIARQNIAAQGESWLLRV